MIYPTATPTTFRSTTSGSSVSSRRRWNTQREARATFRGLDGPCGPTLGRRLDPGPAGSFLVVVADDVPHHRRRGRRAIRCRSPRWRMQTSGASAGGEGRRCGRSSTSMSRCPSEYGLLDRQGRHRRPGSPRCGSTHRCDEPDRRTRLPVSLPQLAAAGGRSSRAIVLIPRRDQKRPAQHLDRLSLHGFFTVLGFAVPNCDRAHHDLASSQIKSTSCRSPASARRGCSGRGPLDACQPVQSFLLSRSARCGRRRCSRT